MAALVLTLVTVADFSVYSGQKLVTECRGQHESAVQDGNADSSRQKCFYFENNEALSWQ